MMDIKTIRKQFPFLKQEYIYFDSAATSLKPQSVIDKESEYYSTLSINTNRGSSSFNYTTSKAVEDTRKRVSKLIGSKSDKEIIFTANTTDSINRIATGYIKNIITSKSNIVITQLEHHSNYAPWLNLSKELNIEIRIAKLKNGKISTESIIELIDSNTVITSITGMSNLSGQQLDIKRVSKKCREYGSKILVDAAQLISHKKIDVLNLDIDFLCFSAHKLYGTFGLGILYIKEDILKDYSPLFYGGNMISYISKDNVIHYKDAPYKYEFGTQNAAAIYSFNGALDLLESYPIEVKESYVLGLSEYLTKKLHNLGYISLYSFPGSIISFNIDGVHPHDASQMFDKHNILVRVGNLCASPYFMSSDFSGVIRVSLDIYNTKDELDLLIKTIIEIKEFFDEFI